jgi:hypothetical protein
MLLFEIRRNNRGDRIPINGSGVRNLRHLQRTTG